MLFSMGLSQSETLPKQFRLILLGKWLVMDVSSHNMDVFSAGFMPAFFLE
jgi:hypothetical protein